MTYSVAVSGASGYAGGEILRILSAHPDVEIRTVTAHSSAGQPLISAQPHLRSLAHLTLRETTPEVLAGHDIVFLALPHGQSGQYTDALSDTPLVLDAGADHRLESATDWDRFYGGDFTSRGRTACPSSRLRGAHSVSVSSAPPASPPPAATPAP
jgi:N-acetyl-gamma-glutamyl-phosphate reductase